MNFRKIIAVLAAALMLCSIIPMSAMVSAASVLDINFDDGTTGSFKVADGETIVVEDGAMKWTTASWKNLYHNFTVSANTDYKLTIKLKGSAASKVEIKFLNGSWGDSGITKYVPSFTTEWAEYTYIFNSGSNGGMVLLFQSHLAGDVYIDDIKIDTYVAPVDPVFPENAIYTETFENGTLNGWANNCSVAETAGLAATNAEGGNYALEFISPSYSYTNYQLAVEPNTDYKVVFSILSATSGYPINARIRGNNVDLALIQYTPSTTAWETHSYTFNSGDYTSVGLRFQAAWTTGTYYIDNVYVVPFDRGTISNDGHVLNGDWETGDTVEWASSPNVEVVEDPTGSGQGYVIKTFETSSSATDMFVQEFKNLVTGKEYTLSFKVYGYGTATNNAFFVRFPKAFTTWSVTTDLGTAKNNDYTPRINLNSSTGAWYDVDITFTAQATTAKVQFMNYRSGQGFYYFDDIALSHAYDEEVTEPDCENEGFTTYTCACGASYKDNYVDATGHAYAESARVDATCGADGSVTYTCGNCGASYDEPLYATGEHEYDNEYDVDCNVCGDIREVEMPIVGGETSASEDVRGVAAKFDIDVIDLAVAADTTNVADYTGATVNGYKLISMGAIASNYKSEKDIPCVYLWDLAADSASFAVRVKNIPEAYENEEITFTPYFIIEIDGEATTIYGDAVVATYAAVIA